ncbi:MAG: hypothetical protein CENE_01158 [Candidatus Celerinatantimonas neptuna]|nr:MAG: hypothetical protein CENE_01158 [Candidatus Celerinatantimonas neptuna]
MQFIEDFDEQSVPMVIDKNQLSYDLYLERSEGITLEKNDQFIWMQSSNPGSMFNGVLETTIRQDNPETLILDMLEQLKSKVDVFSWKVWASSSPPNLKNLLEHLGLRVASKSPGMAVDLTSMKWAAPKLEKLNIRQVSHADELALWVNTLIEGFQLGQRQKNMYRKILTDAGFQYPVKNYLGIYHDKPVATATCFFSDGVVGIYWVSTLTEFRGRGIGRGMMDSILKDALDAGYRVAILQASSVGFPLYQKIGFAEYCHNIRYQWDALSES